MQSLQSSVIFFVPGSTPANTSPQASVFVSLHKRLGRRDAKISELDGAIKAREYWVLK